MFTRILSEDVMSTMLAEDFPSDRLSQPKYKVKVEKDVFIKMRDGVHVAVDVYRPDATGEFPALYASSPYQKDLYHLPACPPVSTCARPTRSSGSWSAVTPMSTTTSGAAANPWKASGVFTARTNRTIFYDVIEWDRRSALVYRQGGDDRRVLLRLGPMAGPRPPSRLTWPALFRLTAARTCIGTWPTTGESWPRGS